MESTDGEKLPSVSSLVTVFEDSSSPPRLCSCASCSSPRSPQTCSVLRTPGAAPRVRGPGDTQHPQGLRPPLSPGPWEMPPAEQAPISRPRTVSRSYLNSLKDKLSSGAWRRSCQPGTQPESGPQEPEEKRIVRELLETEQAYVGRLHLLDQVFFQELLREARSSKAFPEDVVRLIFSNISSIYQFHAQFFLPELQRRLEDWTATPRIGDVIQKLAPFLKMYGEYVKNFDRAAELLAAWAEKSPPFQEVIARIQSSEASGSLTLQHHLLEPVQRIPRYELLLREYVRKLPPAAADRPDARGALDVISAAAQHSNAAIAEMERLQDLWAVYQRLGLDDDIVDPSNALLREGPVLKISSRRRDPMERYLFLVGAHFQVRTRIDVAGMKVRPLPDSEFPHSFLVSGRQRTLELQARSQEEMISWMQACQAAVDHIERRNETFKAAAQGPEGDAQEQELQSEELGLRAPQWVRDKMVTMCMRCQEPFNALTRRRHHCRACGYVVCARCSDYRAELQYDRGQLHRVCAACYTFLTGRVLPEEREDRRRGILQKGAAAGPDGSVMSGFLQLLGDRWGRNSSRSWCVIPRDDPLVLYVYAAPQDVRALTTIPLLGYQVTAGPQGDPRAFQLQQSGQLFTFRAETEELRGRWVEAVGRVAGGEIPEAPDPAVLSD
ncbi:PREDICTED: FYVE, RhoGEF and PH domain-containing protein 2 isoform X2 [Chinchilla lanigera]|uniref:FYVE, RhoGEF and PH domain-containing protein 2 isoform X2 n=1 Tax=Chinchilla lanigera TaxID=34839 RepID=UPI00038EA4BE|nr:PREDICTED: FYVE, RhoGEF and PH domain-containing protein 2 isoform X2 [Chinchilla lanigera]